MHRLGWYLKQLLPFRYKANYKQDDVDYFVTWKMWLGRCYNVDNRIVGD